jgi:hypothetical protein
MRAAGLEKLSLAWKVVRISREPQASKSLAAWTNLADVAWVRGAMYRAPIALYPRRRPIIRTRSMTAVANASRAVTSSSTCMGDPLEGQRPFPMACRTLSYGLTERRVVASGLFPAIFRPPRIACFGTVVSRRLSDYRSE